MVNPVNVLIGVSWFLTACVMDYICYPLILPITRMIPGQLGLIAQISLFLVMILITLVLPALMIMSDQEDEPQPA